MTPKGVMLASERPGPLANQRFPSGPGAIAWGVLVQTLVTLSEKGTH